MFSNFKCKINSIAKKETDNTNTEYRRRRKKILYRYLKKNTNQETYKTKQKQANDIKKNIYVYTYRENIQHTETLIKSQNTEEEKIWEKLKKVNA